MKVSSRLICALLVAGLVGWAGCDTTDDTVTGTDTTGTDARPAGETVGDTPGTVPPDTATGTDTTGTGTTGTDMSGTGTGTDMGTPPATAPSDTGTGAPR